MPKNVGTFVPGGRYNPLFPHKSSLSDKQQEHCLNAMKLLTLNKPSHQLKQTESYSLEVYKKALSKITQEQNKFNEFVRDSWESDRKRIAAIKNNLYKYGCMINKKCSKRYLEYRRYYKEHDLLNTNYIENNDVVIEVNFMQNLLELVS